MNIELMAPYWLCLLPLPLLIHRLLPAFATQQRAIRVPFFELLISALEVTPSQGAIILQPARWQRLTLLLSWLLVCVALANPNYLAPIQQREQSGRDLMVVVDLSGSMQTEDFTTAQGKRVSRLAALKTVLHDFASQRPADRLGLILFADAAFVQSPFTADHTAWLNLLDEAEIPMAGQNTHLGDAIGLAVKLLSDSEQSRQPTVQNRSSQKQKSAPRDKLAIVLTDGNDTDSLVPPLEAAKLAQAKGVRLHVVAMGDPQTTGENALDIHTLQQITSLTGGQLFTALDRQSLSGAYDSINALEPKIYLSERYQPKIALYPYLMMAVLLLHLLAFSLAGLQRYRRRRHV